jgi:hypothetical protein
MNRSLPRLPLLLSLLLSQLLALGAIGAASAANAAEPDTLAGCRAIADGKARLACYDALPLAAPARASTAPATATGKAAPAAGALPRQTPEQFGLEKKKQIEELDAVESNISGEFDGWKPDQWIKLTNGQIWQVNDDSDGWVRNSNSPKVKIQRGLLGAFYMEIETGNRTLKVKRLK